MSWQDDPEVAASAPVGGKWMKDPEIGDAQKMGMTDRIAGFVNRQAQGFQQGMQVPNLVAQKAMQGVTGLLNLPHRLVGAPEITTDPATLTKGFEGVIQDVNKLVQQVVPTPYTMTQGLGQILMRQPQVPPTPLQQPVAHFIGRGLADVATPENAVLAATGVGLEPMALKLLGILFGAQQVPEVGKALQQGDKEGALLKAVESGAMLGGGLIPEIAAPKLEPGDISSQRTIADLPYTKEGPPHPVMPPIDTTTPNRQIGLGTTRFIAPEQGPAQRVFSGVPVTPEDLRPAIRWAGRLFVGERGMTHSDIVDKFNLPKEIDHFHPGRGFAVKGATKPEEFLDRQQTAKIIGKATADAGGADSMDLPGAAQHKLLRESEAPNAIPELRADSLPQAQPSSDIRPMEEEIRQGTGAEGAAREAQIQGQEGVQGRAGAPQRQAPYGRGIDDRQESYFSGVPIEPFRQRERELRGPFALTGPRLAMTPKEIGFSDTGKQVDAVQLRNRLKNKLTPTEWGIYESQGIGEFLKEGEKKSPEEVAKWMQEKGPRVEVRKVGLDDYLTNSRSAQRVAEITHRLDTELGTYWGEIPIDKVDLYIGKGSITQEQANLIKERDNLVKTEGVLTGTGKTTHWQSISPKPESEMEGYMEGAVTIPIKDPAKIRFAEENYSVGSPIDRARTEAEGGLMFPSSHSFPPNTLGFFRGYMEPRPDGGKTFHVIEVQSDWAQQFRERSSPEVGGNIQGHPLLKDYERLTLKAAIDHARKEGADRIAISDAETAMMTEGHDIAAKHFAEVYPTESNKRKALLRTSHSSKFVRDSDTDKVVYVMDQGQIRGLSEGKMVLLDSPEAITYWKDRGFDVSNERIDIDQAPGMRLHYDRTLPQILKELTGEEGKRVEFGPHKMIYPDQTFRVQGRLRDDFIFKNSDGTPKTSISAREFNLSRIAKEVSDKPLSLIGKDRPGSRETLAFSGVPISEEFLKRFGEFGRRIISNPNAVKLETKAPKFPQPGERITTIGAIQNKLKKVANAVVETDRILNPYDVIFDEADGGKGQYNGVLHKTIRQPTDEAYQRSAEQARNWTGNLASIVKSNNLDDLASQRIGVAMTALQEGGRERMIAMGVEPATIDKITSSLTYAEKQWMREFRRIDDGILKRLQEVASKADKIKVKEVKNHFPYMRDFDKYSPELDEIATNPKLTSDKAKREGITPDDVIWAGLPTELGGRVVPGSTIARTPGAKTPIRLDAFGVADKYLRDMSHYLESRELVKKLGEVARSEEFQKTYGDLNQKLVVEYLNNFARQGRWKRNQVIDALRRGVGRGIVGLRLPSQIVHMANIPLAMQRTGGPIWWNRGLQASLGEEGVKFLHDNFEETFQRGGGEPAQAEIAEHQAASKLGKMYDSYGRFAFALQREIDMRSAQATVMGIYMRGLEEKGIKGEDFASVLVDKDLVQKARVLARRAVASPIFKDVPPALQRGGSIGRSFLQFQNTFLDQWSNIRYDLAKVGVPEALRGNPRIALTMAAALASMLAVETTVKYGYKKALTEATGGEMQEDDTYQNHLWHEALRRVPGAGQIMSAIMYGETGIPSIDVLLAPAKEGVKALKSKDEASATIAATRAVGAAAELGIPGASQATDIAVGLERGKFYKPHEKRLEEFTKKPISEMTTDERIEAERSFRQRAQQPMSREAKAQSAERAVANIEKRGEEVEAKLPKETRNWMKARGFSVPGFDNKIQMGGTRVYLTKEETKKLEGYVQEEYQNAIKEIQSERPFDDMPQQRQQEAFNKRLRLAAKVARNRVIEEMDRDAQKMNMTKKYKLLQGE